jgi:hypothetical protein
MEERDDEGKLSLCEATLRRRPFFRILYRA